MSVQQRFWAKVRKGDVCWNWTAALDHGGYGHFRADGKTVRAHRFSYELHVGPIPVGLQIDHLCRNTRCVNPDHLEAVTGRVNTRRGFGPTARNARKTHCDRGHPLTSENLMVHKPGAAAEGQRICRLCQQEVKRQRRAKSRPPAEAALRDGTIYPKGANGAIVPCYHAVDPDEPFVSCCGRPIDTTSVRPAVGVVHRCSRPGCREAWPNG
jgi:hypothetical protein